MTPNIPPEVLALAREIADTFASEDNDYEVHVAIAAIMEVTERAAAMVEDYGDLGLPRRIFTDLRNWEHLKQ